MRMKIDLKNFGKNIDTKAILKKVGEVTVKKEKLMLAGLSIVLIGYCGYLWYAYSYHYQWTESRKQEYINNKSAGTVFNKTKFDHVVEIIKARQAEYQKDADKPKDIFKLK